VKSREVFEHFFPMPAGVRWVESESMIPQYTPAEFLRPLNTVEL